MAYRFDRHLPYEFSTTGRGDFERNIVPEHLMNDLTVYDVGGRKKPASRADLTSKYDLQILGLDIDRKEPAQAPEGYYQCLSERHISRYLPDRVKRWSRFTVVPDKERLRGLPARYDRCTRRDMQRLPARHGREVDRRMLHYQSSYFSFFVPLCALWRANQLGFQAPARAHAAEIFSLVLRKP